MGKKFKVTLEFDAVSDTINDPNEWVFSGIFNEYPNKDWFNDIKLINWEEIAEPKLSSGRGVINKLTGIMGVVSTYQNYVYTVNRHGERDEIEYIPSQWKALSVVDD